MRKVEKVNFLNELSTLLNKYNAAICSRNTGEYSEVFFQFDSLNDNNVETHRLHSSGYEIGLFSEEMTRN